MSYINVNVVAPGEVNAPDTGTLTHASNIITGGSNAFYIGMGVITAIALIVILPIIFARKGLFKKPVSGFSFSLRPGSVSSNGTYVTSN